MSIRETVSASLLGLVALAACNERDVGQRSGPEQGQGTPLPEFPQSTPNEAFEQMKARLEAEKPFYMQRQLALLQARYDLSDNCGSSRVSTRDLPDRSARSRHRGRAQRG